MRKLLFGFLILSSFGFAQTTCVNCGGLTNITEVPTVSVTSTVPILAPNGVVGAPAYSFANNPTYGWWLNSTVPELSIAGVAKVAFVNQNLQMGSNGFILFTSTTDPNGTPDTMLTRRGAANFRFGSTDLNGSPVAQTLSVQNAITGTDLPGAAAFTIAAPLGTGAGAGSSLQLQRAQMLGTGTTAQTGVAALVVCESKTLSNTSATAQTLANIALASNSGGGARGSITVVATDGTNFDSETQDFVVSYVNKATVGTVGTAAITASTAANNSGSATIGMTATFAGTTLSIKATPVFTTIVPTTVTAYLELQNHGAGAVTCQ